MPTFVSSREILHFSTVYGCFALASFSWQVFNANSIFLICLYSEFSLLYSQLVSSRYFIHRGRIFWLSLWVTDLDMISFPLIKLIGKAVLKELLGGYGDLSREEMVLMVHSFRNQPACSQKREYLGFIDRLDQIAITKFFERATTFFTSSRTVIMKIFAP